MSANKRAGQFISGVISNPTFILYFVIALVLFIIVIRWLRKDKRAAKAAAKALEQRVEEVAAREKDLYPKIAVTFGIDEQSAKYCDDIAYKINGAIAKGIFKEDDEETILQNLKRLGGAKTIRCADFFFREYHKNTNNDPNIAYDSLSTLTRSQYATINPDLQTALMNHARLKGEPSFDLFN